MNTKKIAILGGGNLGNSVAKGLMKSQFPPNQLWVTRRRVSMLEDLQNEGVNTGNDNLAAAQAADVIILAVKPVQAPVVLQEIKSALNENKILISLVTGMSLEALEKEAGVSLPTFRAMPNTAVALQESMTCIACNTCPDEHKELVEEMFKCLGLVIFIQEEMMASATVLGACGIAFALRFIRAAMQGGIEIGFGADVALQIAAQTVKGATELVLQTGHHPEREIDKVTTPMGITISGLNEMEHQGFSSALIQGIMTSFNKVNK